MRGRTKQVGCICRVFPRRDILMCICAWMMSVVLMLNLLIHFFSTLSLSNLPLYLPDVFIHNLLWKSNVRTGSRKAQNTLVSNCSLCAASTAVFLFSAFEFFASFHIISILHFVCLYSEYSYNCMRLKRSFLREMTDSCRSILAVEGQLRVSFDCLVID